MRTLAFDGRMGASGDMLCGALLAAGADPDVLTPVERALDVRYAIDTTTKNGVDATTVTVLLDDESTDGHGHSEVDDDRSHDHTHSHDDNDHEHTHEGHDHHGDHDHSHDHTHAEGAGPTRSYIEVIELVESIGLPEEVEKDATAIFEILGEAEAAVHGTDLDATHFHEVGADDAIADVVGATLLLDSLDVERVVTTPIAGGGGTVAMSHGTYPVPAPAVVEVVERADWALHGGPVDGELLTPTGAAILAHLADGVERLPALDLDASGYGAGDHGFPEHPNVLRALVGTSSEGLTREGIRVLETNLDDAPPEVLGGLHDSLKQAGARDVSILPTTMKKSRPGHLVKVIVKSEDAERVARRLAVETGTLGVRETGARHRWVAERVFETATIAVESEEYEVAVKIASDSEGTVYDVSAEYDDASVIAAETDVPIREVMRRAENTVRNS
ncbi:nickel pincer cofactor biosynthesis protein LarC [Halococcus qingdaonensis]|uniref:nickel pincer cofactor biosynthesis protein LarC n=1 Tax=Halococcus qingdaonensis TaxID=224402 RepID=UPI002116012A|nr:nickel pincer cofactor biosynthesis protein LarC [Halococcus qingdaonensis]